MPVSSRLGESTCWHPTDEWAPSRDHGHLQLSQRTVRQGCVNRDLARTREDSRRVVSLLECVGLVRSARKFVERRPQAGSHSDAIEKTLVSLDGGAIVSSMLAAHL